MSKFRSLMVATVLLMVAGFVATIGQGHVRAQDAALTASVVTGSCDDPGDSAGDLRDLSEAEGGVLTSFSRVDIPIDEFTGDGYAIVVAADGDAVACGDATGSGDDVYIAIKSTSDAGYGGVAWLHARDSQTQVSLFISEGLGGGGGGDLGNVEPPSEETPEPPVEETPKPTKTPKSGGEEPAGDLTTYESPTWGYTMEYDASFWEVLSDETQPTQYGPMDFFRLGNGSTTVLLYSNSTDKENFDATIVPDFLINNLSGQEGVSNVTEIDRGGDSSAAWVQIEFTWTNSSGKEFNYTDYYVVHSVPDQKAVAVFLFEDFTESWDLTTDQREALINSIKMP
jgi:hypothetical protein